MTVYIEQVIIDNFAMTGLVCLMSNKMMNQPNKWLQIIIVCTLGTLIAVLQPLLGLGQLWLVMSKLGTGVVLGVILAIGKRKKVMAIVIFFVATFILGGAVFAVNYFVYSDIAYAVNSPVAPFSTGLIILIGVLCYALVASVFAKLFRAKDIATFQNMAVVTVFDREYKFVGFVDSGNKLYFKGKPVALVPKSKLQSPQLPLVAKQHLSVDTVAGKTELPIIVASKIVLYSGTSMNIMYNTPLGLVDKVFEDFDILLPVGLAS